MISRITVGDLATNCWIIPTENGCIVADPGGDADNILTSLGTLHLAPRYIVLTHTHFDHLAALPDLAAAFPEAIIAVHHEEAAKLGPDALEWHRRDFGAAGAASYVDQLWKPLPDAGMFLTEGDALGSFTVMHLPGHSPGSIGLVWKEEKILLSGDTLFHSGTGRTDLPGGNQKELERSLERLFAMDGDIQVYPGHGETTSIRREQDMLRYLSLSQNSVSFGRDF
jgi:glyoxylase-like metal-dependent hydrolase (beta-lactamase superfamily II)